MLIGMLDMPLGAVLTMRPCRPMDQINANTGIRTISVPSRRRAVSYLAERRVLQS